MLQQESCATVIYMEYNLRKLNIMARFMSIFRRTKIDNFIPSCYLGVFPFVPVAKRRELFYNGKVICDTAVSYLCKTLNA
jgi:hypothetical protein